MRAAICPPADGNVLFMQIFYSNSAGIYKAALASIRHTVLLFQILSCLFQRFLGSLTGQTKQPSNTEKSYFSPPTFMGLLLKV